MVIQKFLFLFLFFIDEVVFFFGQNQNVIMVASYKNDQLELIISINWKKKY